MKRRNLILLLGGTSSGAMSIGTGAFSSMEAERGVEVNVADDMNAFVRYETPNDEEEICPGDRITIVRIQNQFGASQQIALVGVEIRDDHEILDSITAERKLSDQDTDGDNDPDEDPFEEIEDVSIEQNADASEFPAPDEDEAFGPGGVARVVADADLGALEEANIEVTITVKGVEGSGVMAQIFGDTRSFTIERNEPDEISGVTFNGARNAKADGASGCYTVDFWFVDTDDESLENGLHQERSWNGDGNVNSADANQNSDVGNRRLLALRFQETEQTFCRPEFDISEGDVPWSVENLIEGDENRNGSENADND